MGKRLTKKQLAAIFAKQGNQLSAQQEIYRREANDVEKRCYSCGRSFTTSTNARKCSNCKYESQRK